jgi:nucleoid DNA-binding protein
MNKSDLVRAVYEKMDQRIALKDIDQIVDAMLAIMADKLKAGEEVQLADFGTFSIKTASVKTIAEFLPRKKRNIQPSRSDPIWTAKQ